MCAAGQRALLIDAASRLSVVTQRVLNAAHQVTLRARSGVYLGAVGGRSGDGAVL